MSELNALQQARKIISQRASDPKAKMFGLSDDLKAIGAALDELERRNGIAAEFGLLLYEHLQSTTGAPKVHSAVIAELGQMNDHAGVITRRLSHGNKCTCGDCIKAVSARDSRPIYPVM